MVTGLHRILAVLVLGLILTCVANEPVDPLDKMVGISFNYNSFNEAIQQIETKTGFKVRYTKDLGEFMQTRFMGVGEWDPKNPGPEPQKTIRSFLDRICGQINVGWNYDASANTVDLDLPWKTADTRSPEKLLKFIHENAFSGGSEAESKWAHAFNALISNPENINLAWKVRQAADLERIFWFLRPLKPTMIKPIISTGLQKYLLVLFDQHIIMYPGHGSVSYYCFKDNGTLAIAGIINTGHRCALIDVTVDNEDGSRSESPSEIHMILKMNMRNFFIARLHLEDDGLELFSLVNAYGEPVNNEGLSIGVSLLK